MPKPITPDIREGWKRGLYTMKLTFTADHGNDEGAEGIEVDTASVVAFTEALLFDARYMFAASPPPMMTAENWDTEGEDYHIEWCGLKIKIPTELRDALIQAGEEQAEERLSR